jgi:hypothetical protein
VAVRAREHEALVAVLESDEVRRGAVGAADFENLGVLLRMTHLAAVDE